MKKCKIGSSFLCFFVALSLFGASVFSVSCKMTAEGIVAVSEDVHNPVLSDFFQESEDSLVLCFSEEVSITNMEVRSAGEKDSGQIVLSSERIEVAKVAQEGGKEFKTTGETALQETEGASSVEGSGKVNINVTFKDGFVLEPGFPYVLSGVAHDKKGNSLFFQVPFHGFNRNVAKIVLSEVKPGYNKPEVEFIEFYVYKPGNLAGIILNTVNKDFEYVFPSVEVSEGEYVVLHMRTLSQESGHVNELGEDLNLSTAPDSCTDARDLWVPMEERIVGNSDVITLRERWNGRIMDALLYAHPDISVTVQKKTLPVAQQLVEAGAWQGEKGLDGWVQADGLTNTSTTRSLSRQNIQAFDEVAGAEIAVPLPGPQDCFVTAKAGKVSGITPGLPNSTTRYVAD